MRGIDISHYDEWPLNSIASKAYKESDFIIVKATQGINYKYVNYFKPAIDKVLADKKLGGAYHYASGNDPKEEAEYFISIVKPYIGKIILALDWEEDMNKAYGNTTWAKQFIDYVKEKTNITCFLYTGMDELQQCKILANKVPLWFAGYPTNDNSWTIPKWPSHYTTKPWTHYEIWQFTSGQNKLDRNISNMTPIRWKEFAEGKKSSQASPGASTISLVIDTLEGKYGNGAIRKNMLGTRYDEVQQFINHIAFANVEELAKETIEDKFGTGEIRKLILGDRYAEVQKKVNELLNG